MKSSDGGALIGSAFAVMDFESPLWDLFIIWRI
jgi:hypothetical protein